VQQLLGVVHRSLEEVFEVLILRQLLITSLPPLSDSLTDRDQGLVLTSYTEIEPDRQRPGISTDFIH